MGILAARHPRSSSPQFSALFRAGQMSLSRGCEDVVYHVAGRCRVLLKKGLNKDHPRRWPLPCPCIAT
jgi:hypothetical protein